MKIYALITAVLVAGCMIGSCQCGRNPEPLTVPADTLAMPQNGITEKQAFEQGRADGLEMVRTCGTDTLQLRKALLHAHSCASAYGMQLGQKAMVDYRAGLRAAISDKEPDLAKILFK